MTITRFSLQPLLVASTGSLAPAVAEGEEICGAMGVSPK
jgi:hypothetical protein